jgi:hypothetical protein
MFASKNDLNYAYCLIDYKSAKAGFTIPKTNKMWEIVEEWLEDNNGEWAEMPNAWPPTTYSQELAELNAEYIAKVDALAEKITKAKAWDGASETSKVTALRSQKTGLDTKYISDLTLINEKWSN